MDEIKLNIIDRERTVSGLVHASMGQGLIASLTAEPETFAELEAGLRRFVIWEIDSPLSQLREGEDLVPADWGLLVIDLTSRTVCAYDPKSEEEDEEEEGFRFVWIETPLAEEEGFHLPFLLSEDWLVLPTFEEFAEKNAERRKDREANPPIDYRAVMYGPALSDFIARECANLPRPTAPPESVDDDPAVDVHKRWYMTPREDLGGKTPRDVLFYKRNFVGRDLEWRERQWSFAGLCPPHIRTDTNAYKFSGFGTHEWVIYYYLVRELIERAIYDEDRAMNLAEESARLISLKDAWLETPDPEYYGRTPAGIIESERRRIGISMSAKEMIIDEDCPCCQMMAEDFSTPMFWHLDGCNMDDCFEFSYHGSQEEYDKEQREWAQRSAEIEAENERKRQEFGPDWFKLEMEENYRQLMGEYRDKEYIDDGEDDGVPF
jgi:hypothetical protein